MVYRKKARRNDKKNKPRNVVKAPLCPYCGKRSKLMTGAEALSQEIGSERPDLLKKLCYACVPCNARVWCHEHNGNPLGTLANRECRLLRKVCHRLFDELWESGRMTRDGAYVWLAKQLGLTRRQCHFALFQEAMCKRAIEVLEHEKLFRV